MGVESGFSSTLTDWPILCLSALYSFICLPLKSSFPVYYWITHPVCLIAQSFRFDGNCPELLTLLFVQLIFTKQIPAASQSLRHLVLVTFSGTEIIKYSLRSVFKCKCFRDIKRGFAPKRLRTWFNAVERDSKLNPSFRIPNSLFLEMISL